MRELLIVDGYNMIGAWAELVILAEEGSLEAARDQLIAMLADYQGYSGRRVIVVFDAYYVPGAGKTYQQHRIDVRYTKEKETADECIERLVYEKASRHRRIYVATSDMVEQHMIFGSGALRISARELLILVKQSRREMRRSIEKETSTRRNPFDGKMTDEVRGVLEKWRRGQYEE